MTLVLPSTAPQQAPRILARLCGHLAIAVWLLMGVGCATRVMNAGLACPDWPLCYGRWLPLAQMNLQVFLEWFHRLDAALVGFGLLGLTGLSWVWRSQLPAWVPGFASLSLLLVVLQAGLGALTVTQLLRFDIVTAHLGTALLLFGLLVGLRRALSGPIVAVMPLAAVTSLAVYAQSLLGGLTGSRWALHQCLGGDRLCTVLSSHLWSVLPVALLVLLLAWRQRDWRLAALLGLQLVLGWGMFRWHLQIEPLTVAHQMTATLLLALGLGHSLPSAEPEVSA